MHPLRRIIREAVQQPERHQSTLTAPNGTDLGLAINWGRLNDMILAVGQRTKNAKGQHTARVTHVVSKAELRKLLKDRFGVFIEVS